jgi:hypothetical protein
MLMTAQEFTRNSAGREVETMREDTQDDLTPARIKYLLQQSILRHYPNPERNGCLDSPILQTIAQQRLPHQDERWEHVSHCSPCYREFLERRRDFRKDPTLLTGI